MKLSTPEIANFPFTHIEACRLKDHLGKLLKNMEDVLDPDPGYVCIAIEASSYPGFPEYISRAFVRNISKILFPCQPAYERSITLSLTRPVVTELIHRSGAPTFFLIAHSLSGDPTAKVSQARVLDLLENLEQTFEVDSYFSKCAERLEDVNKKTLYHLMRMENEPISMDEVDMAVTAMTEFKSLAAWRIHWIKSMVSELDVRIEDPTVPIPKTDLTGLTADELMLVRQAVTKFISKGESVEYLCNSVSSRFNGHGSFISWLYDRLEASMMNFVDEHFNGSLAERLLFTKLAKDRGLYELYPFLMFDPETPQGAVRSNVFQDNTITMEEFRVQAIQKVKDHIDECDPVGTTFSELLAEFTDTSNKTACEFLNIVSNMTDFNWRDSTQMTRRIGTKRREWAMAMRDETYNVQAIEGDV